MMIFDANNAVLGRIASRAAKALLNGEEVFIINAEHAVIGGDPRNTIDRYKARREARNKANPEHSPHWSRRPDMLVKRIVRGMIPFDRPRGKIAIKRLRVYMGVPDELKSKKVEPIGREVKAHSKSIIIKDLCRELGWYGQA